MALGGPHTHPSQSRAPHPPAGPHRLPLSWPSKPARSGWCFLMTCSKVLPGPEYTPEGLRGFYWWNRPRDRSTRAGLPFTWDSLGSALPVDPHCLLSGRTPPPGRQLWRQPASGLILTPGEAVVGAWCFVSTSVRWHSNPLSASKVCGDLGTAPGMPRGSGGLQLLLGPGPRKPGAGNRANLNSGPC